MALILRPRHNRYTTAQRRARSSTNAGQHLITPESTYI
jgi:hypothetical protein